MIRIFCVTIDNSDTHDNANVDTNWYKHIAYPNMYIQYAYNKCIWDVYDIICVEGALSKIPPHFQIFPTAAAKPKCSAIIIIPVCMGTTNNRLYELTHVACIIPNDTPKISQVARCRSQESQGNAEETTSFWVIFARFLFPLNVDWGKPR